MRKHASPGPLTDAQAFCSGMEKALKTKILRFFKLLSGFELEVLPGSWFAFIKHCTYMESIYCALIIC